MHDDARAVGGETQGDGATYSASRAGYQRDSDLRGFCGHAMAPAQGSDAPVRTTIITAAANSIERPEKYDEIKLRFTASQIVPFTGNSAGALTRGRGAAKIGRAEIIRRHDESRSARYGGTP